MVNIRKINLSLDDLRLIAQSRNISEHENNSKEDLTKALSESEPKPKLKLRTKLKPEPKTEKKINRKKLKKLRKDFDELGHKFSNKDEIREYRKAFYHAKKYKLSESEIEKVRKNLNKLKKSLKSKKFHGGIDSVDYEDLDNYDNDYYFADDDKYRKNKSIGVLFKEFYSDYYKPIRTDDGFAGKKIITLNIRLKEIDMKIYHLKNILMWLDHI